MSAGKVVVSVLRADATIGPLIGNARCYPADGVPKGGAFPYTAWSVQRNAIDRDLNGRVAGYSADVLLEVAGETVSQVQTILAALPIAFSGLGGTTIAGVAVDDAEAIETGDEINGPFDLDDEGQAYTGSATISIYYGGS